MKFAYYPGCSAQSTCKELNASLLVVAEKLGLELTEYASASCTGSREIRAVRPELFLALNARIMAMAERDNLPLMTVCNTCTLNFLDTQKRLEEDPEAKDRVNEVLKAEGLRYRGKCRVTHFLWMLLDDIGAERLRHMVVRPLKGLKLAAFYGCHIVRPPAHFQFFDSRNARSIETINSILGLLRACQRGIGVALLPDYLVEENGGLVQLFGESDSIALDAYFVYPEELKTVARVQVFRDFLVAKAQRWHF